MKDKPFSAGRRDAARKISLGIGAGLAGLPNAYSLFSSSQKEVLGVALVGLGNYSNIMLGPALRETKRCRLAGIVTGTPEKAEKWAKEYDIPEGNIYNYDNFDSIAENPDIDIIYIVLPNFMHAEYTIRAAKAGKHVICEKPMAMNPREAEAMIKACKENNRLLSVGYRLHYEPHHQHVMKLGKEKPYGPINFIETSFGYHLPDPKIWRLDKEKGGGGAIMDLGVYCIQLSRYGTGEEPISVTAQGFVRDKSRFKGIYETICWQFEFPSGIISNATTTYSSFEDRFYASAYRGWYRLEPACNGRGTSGVTSKGPMTFPKINQQATHMDDFAGSILDGSPVTVPGEEGLRDLQIIEGILEAVRTGGKVSLER